MKLIILDIDGVLNHQDFYERIYKTDRIMLRADIDDEWEEPFCENSTKLINNLIEQTGAKVVISSVKRNIKGDLAYMNTMWKNRGFIGEIIGITPNLWFHQKGGNVPRGCEIEYYLENTLKFHHINWSKERQQEYMDQSGVENYIIIDDDSDMLYGQRNHFVNVLPAPRNTSGFNQTYFNQALAMLSKTVIDLNY